VTTKINLNSAAKRTGLSVKTLRRYIANGILPAYRVGPRAIRVDVDDIESLFKRMPAADRRGR
jgi:excisionase family DNA binding protein